MLTNCFYIPVFAGRTDHFVGFVVQWLKLWPNFNLVFTDLELKNIHVIKQKHPSDGCKEMKNPGKILINLDVLMLSLREANERILSLVLNIKI